MSSALARFRTAVPAFLDMRLQPEIEPRLHRFARRTGQPFVGNDADARISTSSRNQFRHASPVQRMVHPTVSTNCSSAPPPVSPHRHRQRLLARSACNALASEPASARRAQKVNPSSRPINGLLRSNSPSCQFPYSTSCFPQAALNTLVSAINETLREPFMQRIGQIIFDLAAIPCKCSDRPAVRRVGRTKVQVPELGLSGSIACRYRRHPIRLLDLGHRTRQSGSGPCASRKSEQRRYQFGMRGRRDLADKSGFGSVPQPFHRGSAGAPSRAHRQSRRMIEHAPGPPRSGRGSALRGTGVQRSDTCRRAERGEIQLSNCAIAEPSHFEGVILQRVDQFRLERRAAAGVPKVPSRWRARRAAICANSDGLRRRN